MKVLILGATGMLGHALLKVFQRNGIETYGVSRSRTTLEIHPDRFMTGIDATKTDDLLTAVRWAHADVVVNAVGLVKQLAAAGDALQAIPINALLPHRLDALCNLTGARLIHISTDCVFSGDKGGYAEDDRSDAVDLYGLSKRLGEVSESSNTLTLRTSIIGRERTTAHGLVEWFLGAGAVVNGYSNAVFSGLPTVVLAQAIVDHVLPRPELHGLFHIGADSIDKRSLLGLLAKTYGRDVEIVPIEEPRINRSLNSERFRRETGFRPEPWPALVERMRAEQG